jgi:hypothetical protein
MNLIIKTLFYILKNLYFFLNNYNNIKHFPFGKDVENIKIENNIIIKKYINKKKLDKNLNNYNLLKKFYFIPKLLNKKELNLTFEYKGELLNISKNLPTDYIYQLMDISYELANNNILIDDVKPWIINKYIINNLTVINGKIFIVDFGKINFDKKENIIKHYNRLIIDIIKMKNKIY